MKSKLSNVTYGVFLSFLCLSFFSCSKDKLNFESSEQAVEVYHDYYKELKQKKTSNAEDLVKDINEWQELSDTIFLYLMKDSAFVRQQNVVLSYYQLGDSIKKQFIRLSETWKVSYDDVYVIKTGTSEWVKDKDLAEAVQEATPFFESLDSVKLPVMKKEALLSKYRGFLEITLKNGIKTKQEMLQFIREEDKYYRAFLAQLYYMENEKLSGITKNTERICTNIFGAVKDGGLTAKDVMVYMSMRTTRRILLNSTVCLSDINTYRMKSKAQGNAYLWMIIQPYTSIDAFSIATLTERGKNDFKSISNVLPGSLQFAKTFDIDPDVLKYLLPQQLLKMYLMTLEVR